LEDLPGESLRGVEVGCGHGKNARKLLQGEPRLHLIMVDPWSPEYSYGWLRKQRKLERAKSQERNERRYRATIQHLGDHIGRTTIYRMPSNEGAKLVEDQSLDFIFIDGDHRYDAVVEDIELWRPKLKPGGLFSGHDYGHPEETWGVTQAVDEALGDAVNVGDDFVWWVRCE
jgi:SAM-dependent methyltransferase